MTYNEVDRAATAVGAWLQQKLGVERGDRIALMCPNVFAFPIAMHGIIRAGATQVNVNPLYTPRELEHQLNDAGAETIIVSGFNVYPNEIEATVSACEGVVECACVGVPDDKTGEALRVFAVKSDDVNVDAEKIIAHCRIVSNSMTEIAAQFRGARGNLAELFEPRLLRLVQLQCKGHLCVLSRLVQWQFHIPR